MKRVHVKRRAFLTSVSTLTAGVAGCIGSPTATTGSNNDVKWQHEIVLGEPTVTVSNGRVYGTESTSDPTADTKVDGGLFALDLETGELQWTHGSSNDGHPGLGYTVAENGIYAYQTDDQPSTPSSITALDFDGTERWGISGSFADAISDIALINVPGSSHEEGSSDYDLRALDVATGEQLWTSTYGGAVEFDTASSDFPEIAYVNKDTLAAINTNDGTVEWSYGDPEDLFLPRVVSNGVVFNEMPRKDSLVAVSEGEALWTIDSIQPNIEGTLSGYLLVSDLSSDSRFPIYAFDMETGEKQWVQEDIRAGDYGTPVSVYDDRIYIGEQNRISAFTAVDGTEVWNTEIDSNDRVKTLEVVPENEGDHSLFAVIEHSSDDHSLRRINTKGEATWTWSEGEQLRGFAVDESIIVATKSGISALRPS